MMTGLLLGCLNSFHGQPLVVVQQKHYRLYNLGVWLPQAVQRSIPPPPWRISCGRRTVKRSPHASEQSFPVSSSSAAHMKIGSLCELRDGLIACPSGGKKCILGCLVRSRDTNSNRQPVAQPPFSFGGGEREYNTPPTAGYRH